MNNDYKKVQDWLVLTNSKSMTDLNENEQLNALDKSENFLNYMFKHRRMMQTKDSISRLS